MRRCYFLVAVLALPAPVLGQSHDSARPAALAITPGEITLSGTDGGQHLLVTGTTGSHSQDCTNGVSYTSTDAGVVTVSPNGVLQARGNGTAEVYARLGELSATVHVRVRDCGIERRVSFRNEVVPLLTKAGCNAGGCHGKASGQNGFRLSLLGFDPDFDYAALVEEGRGRRLFAAAPAQSLLLRKASAAMPHGGGRRLEPGSPAYALLLRWVRQGAPHGSASDRRVVRIECTPRTAILDRRGTQHLLVTAHYSDGSHRDVTGEAQFKSNEPDVAGVDEFGLVRGSGAAGETAVMARYMGLVDVCRIAIPLASAAAAWPELPVGNYIDEHVRAKWRQLHLVPSPLADDTTFLRRAYLDAIGTLPTPQEVRAFLADPSPDKRAVWVDRILARSEYADFWAVKWGDLLRNQRKGSRENQRGTYAFHAWIRDALATNLPYDRFVRGILAAQGTVDQHPPVIWYRSVRNLTHQTNDTAQLFLGTRIACAQCHHHPYEKWSQDDYYQLQAFFARVGTKAGETAQEPAVFVRLDGAVRNPVTGKVMTPHGLDGPEVVVAEGEDPRQKLVDWMASPDNPFFARALANRLWAHFLSRGLVEPVDDLRVTNPPSNPALLDALAQDFVSHGFDMKHLMRRIMTSTVYQLSPEPTPGNAQDRQNYARAYPRRLPAEVLLDAINQVTGAAENFPGLPKGTRTIQLPDESVPSYFLDVFGRPARETPCECERPREANLAQALQLLNSTELQTKVAAPRGRLATLLAAHRSDAEIIEEFYLAALGRPPHDTERRTVLDFVHGQRDHRAALEDALWAILNTKEFLFNH